MVINTNLVAHDAYTYIDTSLFRHNNIVQNT